MVAAQATMGKFDFGRVVQNTFGVVTRNAKELLLLSLVLVGLPAALFGWLQLSFGSLGAVAGRAPMLPVGSMVLIGVVGYLASVAGSALLQATITRVTIADLNGERASPFAEARRALPSVLPLIGVSFLATVGVMFGMLFLIVPGVILAVVWSVALPACVVERNGVFASFSRSRNLTRGFRWPIFGLLLVFMVVYFVLSAVFGGLTGALSLGSGGAFGALIVASIASGIVISVLVVLLASSGLAAIYYELRAAKEGVGAADLAAVFD